MKLTNLFWIFALAFVLTACSTVDAQPFGTPIAPLPAETLPAPKLNARPLPEKQGCPIEAVNLLGAWVQAGYPETETFPILGMDGSQCLGTFSQDIQPLLNTPNLWYDSAVACTTCHGPDLTYSYAQLNLSDYAGIVAGSRRATPDATGNDILAAGNWEKARLYTVFSTRFMPWGLPADAPTNGPVVIAGSR